MRNPKDQGRTISHIPIFWPWHIQRTMSNKVPLLQRVPAPRELPTEFPGVWVMWGPCGSEWMIAGGWRKSCITLDGWNPINNGINHLSTGAGFLPSTVAGGFKHVPKKMIPVPIVPARTWYIDIYPPPSVIFFCGFVGDGKLNQGFPKNTCRVRCLHEFLRQPLHRLHRVSPFIEWPGSKAPQSQDAICHTSWSEAPGALGWYLGGEALPFIGMNQAPYSTMIIL